MNEKRQYLGDQPLQHLDPDCENPSQEAEYPLPLTLDQAIGVEGRFLMQAGITKVYASAFFHSTRQVKVRVPGAAIELHMHPECFAEFAGTAASDVTRIGRWLNKKQEGR